MADEQDASDFLTFSAAVTAFSEFRLRGTGLADLYFAHVTGVIGAPAMHALLQAFRAARDAGGSDDAALADALRAGVFSDPLLGPVARNIIKLWYGGTWYQLPPEWRAEFGARENDVTLIPSPEAYTEGLLWAAIGANPAGAKPPGFGSWTAPPQIPEI